MSLHLLYNEYLHYHFEDGNPIRAITKVILSKQIRDKIHGHSLCILYNIWSNILQYDTRLGNLPIFF